jgi:hypothetical protein
LTCEFSSANVSIVPLVVESDSASETYMFLMFWMFALPGGFVFQRGGAAAVRLDPYRFSGRPWRNGPVRGGNGLPPWCAFCSRVSSRSTASRTNAEYVSRSGGPDSASTAFLAASMSAGGKLTVDSTTWFVCFGGFVSFGGFVAAGARAVEVFKISIAS